MKTIKITALVLFGCVAGYFVYDRLGWEDIPDRAPSVSRVLNPSYADAARQADATLRDVHHDLGLIGISAAVSIAGKPVWEGAVGWSNPEAKGARRSG